MLKNIRKYYSPNFDYLKRTKNKIKFIIIHYTGMKSENDAIKRLTEIQSEVSSHYLIKDNGQILQLVPDLYVAWHAGKSMWGKNKLLNKSSIGIEISNPGHMFGYSKFKTKQIKSLVNLLKKLKIKYKINPKNILSHSDIAPDRKKDPGEYFPWKMLSKKKLSIWHKLEKKNILKMRNILCNKKDVGKFLKNLTKIGYPKCKKLPLIKAFQMRFRPELVNGKIDKECLEISKSIEKI